LKKVPSPTGRAFKNILFSDSLLSKTSSTLDRINSEFFKMEDIIQNKPKQLKKKKIPKKPVLDEDHKTKLLDKIVTYLLRK
jgi:hypothetical protein